MLRLLYLPALCLLLSCSKGDKKQKGDCPPDLMCTMEYRTITVTITDSSNTPVMLDSYRTVRLSDNHIFDLQGQASAWEDSLWRATGAYPVITDGQQKEMSTGADGTLLEFQGDKDGSTVIREQYRVRDNCCHVELISGRTNVVTGN